MTCSQQAGFYKHSYEELLENAQSVNQGMASQQEKIVKNVPLDIMVLVER